MKFDVLALASATVKIGEVEADTPEAAYKKALPLFRSQRGKPVSTSNFLDNPTIEEFSEVMPSEQ